MDRLPLDCILKIAVGDAAMWFLLVRIFRELADYIEANPKFKLALADKFMVRVVTDTGFHCRLPNGKFHSVNGHPSSFVIKSERFWMKIRDDYELIVHGPRSRDEDRQEEIKRFTALVYALGNTEYCILGKLHSVNDVPSFAFRDGSKMWHTMGEYDRGDDNPAIILADGTKYWYRGGLQHRDGNKPAAIFRDGSTRYYRYGVLVLQDDVANHD